MIKSALLVLCTVLAYGVTKHCVVSWSEERENIEVAWYASDGMIDISKQLRDEQYLKMAKTQNSRVYHQDNEDAIKAIKTLSDEIDEETKILDLSKFALTKFDQSTKGTIVKYVGGFFK